MDYYFFPPEMGVTVYTNPFTVPYRNTVQTQQRIPTPGVVFSGTLSHLTDRFQNLVYESPCIFISPALVQARAAATLVHLVPPT